MKLSIITINFNNRDGLKRTIDSVVSQTCKDFEWIIIDGGSTDGSKELIEQYADHITYWVSEPDKGVYNAMNKGIQVANGEYLNFMNSGDIFYDYDTLKKVFGHNLYAGVVYGDWIKVKNGCESEVKSCENVNMLSILSKNICHQAMFIQTDLLKNDLYNESFKILADWSKWIEFSIKGVTFQYIPTCICKYDMYGISSTQLQKANEEREIILKRTPRHIINAFDEYSKLKQRLEKYEQCPLTKDTLELVYERPLFCKIIHFNLLLVKLLKRILG